MSRKNVIMPVKVLDAGDMSADVRSDATNINFMDNAAYQVVYTGSPTGVFYVEATINGEDWETLDFTVDPEATGSAGSFMFNMNQLPYSQIRLFYDRTSGTGTLNVWIMVKMVGG